MSTNTGEVSIKQKYLTQDVERMLDESLGCYNAIDDGHAAMIRLGTILSLHRNNEATDEILTRIAKTRYYLVKANAEREELARLIGMWEYNVMAESDRSDEREHLVMEHGRIAVE